MLKQLIDGITFIVICLFVGCILACMLAVPLSKAIDGEIAFDNNVVNTYR
jgi:hypothetical protein